MTKKVVLSRAEASAIELLRVEGITDDQVLKYAIKDVFAKEEYYCLSDMAPSILAAALINGYEVEQTPEEKVREYIELERAFNGRNGHFNLSPIGAVKKVLEIYNIKIEGVNA